MKLKLLSLAFMAGVGGFWQNQANAQYCIPSYFTGCIEGDEIDNFEIPSASFSHLGSGCSGGYGDYTASPGLEINVQATVTYDFNVTHNYTNQYIRIWIDFNNDQTFDDLTELLFTSTDPSTYVTNGSFTVPNVVPTNGLRMRVMDNYYNITADACTGEYYGETHDYTVNILPPPPCPQVSDLTAITVGPFDADISWIEQGTASDYIVEWGTPGFTPGTGSELGTDNVSGSTSHTVNGLTPSTDYEVYIRTDCGVDGLSFWTGPLAFSTPCVPVTVLPWTEDFEGTTMVGSQDFPGCWVHEMISGWYGWDVVNNGWNSGDADALSGSYFLDAMYGTDAYMWTPMFELTGGETYEFVFNWAGDTYSGWTGSVFVNDIQNSAGATQLGDYFVQTGDATSLEYKKETYCFTPAADGIYSFGVHVSEIYYYYYMAFDDFELRLANPSAGTDAVVDVCQTDGSVDLNMTGSITDPNGAWNFDFNPFALEQDTLINTLILPAGTYDAIYAPTGCLAPDVTVTFTVQSPSSAGNDGVISACKNQQINLVGALSGDVNLGGVWLDGSMNPVANPYFKTGETAGDYTYYYVATNGVCDPDTAEIVLTINDCDYLGIEGGNLTEVQVYPNPSAGMIYIALPQDADEFSFVVTDMNGRTVLAENNVLANSAVKAVDLTSFENGVYMIRVYNSDGEKVFRIIKN